MGRWALSLVTKEGCGLTQTGPPKSPACLGLGIVQDWSPPREVNSSSHPWPWQQEFHLKVSSTSAFSCHGCAMIRSLECSGSARE